MIDHLRLDVRDIERSRRFSAAALALSGYRVMPETVPGVLGVGADRPDSRLALEPEVATFARVAFRAAGLVDALHRAALDAGGRDDGGPGPGPRYHGAFVLDRAPRAKPVVANDGAVGHAAEPLA